MQPTLENLSGLVAVFFAGVLLSQVAAWVQYHFKVRKIPVAHDQSIWVRLFTRKAREEFAADFEGLSRKGLAKVSFHHPIYDSQINISSQRIRMQTHSESRRTSGTWSYSAVTTRKRRKATKVFPAAITPKWYYSINLVNVKSRARVATDD